MNPFLSQEDRQQLEAGYQAAGDNRTANRIRAYRHFEWNPWLVFFPTQARREEQAYWAYVDDEPRRMG